MQITRTTIDDTKITLDLIADPQQLNQIKAYVVTKLGKDSKVPGFRAGKAPLGVIERQLDQTRLQTEFLDQAVNQLYVLAVSQEKLRPVSAPNVSITKFVPFTNLEIKAEVEIVQQFELPDYSKISIPKPNASVTASEITAVITDLRTRAATKTTVTRAAKQGDEVIIDFSATDAATKNPVDGADGTDYPLLIGSKRFIPGFEEHLLDLKAGDTTSFEISFPKDYDITAMQSQKVIFSVIVKEVKSVKLAVLNDEFAATLGAFKTVTELKADIKKQLLFDKQQQLDRAYENELLEKIATMTQFVIPKVLVETELDRIDEEEKRNLVYRGQTWQEHLDQEGVDEATHRERNRINAETRVKAGLVLADISEQQQITVTPEELDIRIQLLKGQYQDEAMRSEIEKPENKRDVMNRLMTEKTLDRLKQLVAS